MRKVRKMYFALLFRYKRKAKKCSTLKYRVWEVFLARDRDKKIAWHWQALNGVSEPDWTTWAVLKIAISTPQTGITEILVVGPHLCTRIWLCTMIGLLTKPSSMCQSGWREIRNSLVNLSGIRRDRWGTDQGRSKISALLRRRTTQWRIQGRGPGDRSPLIFGPNWGPRGRKNFFRRPPLLGWPGSGWPVPPPHLSQGLDPVLLPGDKAFLFYRFIFCSQNKKGLQFKVYSCSYLNWYSWDCFCYRQRFRTATRGLHQHTKAGRYLLWWS